MNQNRQKNKGFGNRTNNQNNVKKVRFDTSQQWRLSRKQIQANNVPNRKAIQNNLKMIKSGTTPLKRAQAAYYGGSNKNRGGQNRSPLVVQPTRPVKRLTQQDSNKLPVHARLGTKSNLNGVASTARINKKTPQKITGIVTKTNNRENAVQQLIAQKRALRLKTIQQQKKLKQYEQTLKKKSGVLNTGTLRSDQLLRNHKVNRNNVTIKNRIRQNLGTNSSAAAAADLSVSVANDFALQRQLLNGDVAGINNRVNRRHLNRPPLHSNEVDPVIQREISLIQERSRRSKMDPSIFAPPLTNINSTAPALAPVLLQHENPLTQLGGITTSIVPNDTNRPKLSLHERFSLL